MKAGVSVADFKKLPARDQNAYLAEQRGAKTAEGTEPGVQYYDPALIDPSPFNRTYFDEGKNAELIESVRIYGVAQNGIGRPHRPSQAASSWWLGSGDGTRRRSRSGRCH